MTDHEKLAPIELTDDELAAVVGGDFTISNGTGSVTGNGNTYTNSGNSGNFSNSGNVSNSGSISNSGNRSSSRRGGDRGGRG